MVKARRRDRRIWFLVLGVFSAVFLFSFLVTKFKKLEGSVDAASLANFDPGYIISDYQMGNYNSMSEAEIQAFLTKKNPCSNRDYNLYLNIQAAYPGVKWHFENGHFVCISEELFGEGTTIGSGETAAHIIWQAAQDYRINPQVLIVLLQKEQGLITDDVPHSGQYKTATGYGCPDTAPCYSEYFGFKNQVRKAASLFRTVLNGGWTNYPLGSNYIQYNPSASCGGSWVNVRNLATSALYRYTPYQPNAGALAAGYGTAYCGAYGNRNFYLYFEDWFGGVTDNFSLDSLENARIPDGIYSVRNLGSGKMMDINGGTKNAKEGTIVHGWNNNNTDAQQWKISNNGDGTFTIVNPVLDMVLSGNSNLTIEKNRDYCFQKWRVLKYDNDYVLTTTCSNSVLQIYSSTDNAINFGSAVRGDTIKWRIVPLDVGVEEGEYIIKSALDNGKVINATANNKIIEKASNINLLTFSSNEGQIWKIVKNNDNTYSFYNLNNSLFLDVDGGSNKKGANVRMWPSNNSCAQKWRIVQNDGLYVFISACSDLVLDVSGGIPDDGANINLWWFNNTLAQKWTMEKSKRQPLLVDGDYVIKSKLDTDKAVDISGGAEEAIDGENIQLWRENNTNAQIWKVIYNEQDNTYSIINKYTGKAIDVDGAQTVRGANIQIWNSNYTCAQKWRLVREGDYFVLTSACSELVLDVSGGKADLGANINLWTTNGTDAQKWAFELVSR